MYTFSYSFCFLFLITLEISGKRYILSYMWRFTVLLVMMFCAGSLLFSQADRNKRYVAVQSAEMKDSAGFLAKNLGSLALGTEVTVIREEGKWTQVQAGSLSGWVASASLSARRVTTSGSAVTASDVALAGKGFSPDTEMEYKKNGLDYSMVDSMERITIPNDDLLRFVTEGRLNRGD
jgi:uncharacterized protein YgiM (DUF1202 family)